jgi:hypothetical protein
MEPLRLHLSTFMMRLFGVESQIVRQALERTPIWGRVVGDTDRQVQLDYTIRLRIMPFLGLVSYRIRKWGVGLTMVMVRSMRRL